jgi:calmodulin
MSSLSAEQLQTYKETFALFDEDGSGSIDSSELSAVLRKLGLRVSRHALAKMIKAIDKDGNGEIDMNEVR